MPAAGRHVPDPLSFFRIPAKFEVSYPEAKPADRCRRHDLLNEKAGAAGYKS